MKTFGKYVGYTSFAIACLAIEVVKVEYLYHPVIKYVKNWFMN